MACCGRTGQALAAVGGKSLVQLGVGRRRPARPPARPRGRPQDRQPKIAYPPDGARIDVPVEKVTPVDATGAGDQFAAGFIYGIATGRPLAVSYTWIGRKQRSPWCPFQNESC